MNIINIDDSAFFVLFLGGYCYLLQLEIVCFKIVLMLFLFCVVLFIRKMHTKMLGDLRSRWISGGVRECRNCMLGGKEKTVGITKSEVCVWCVLWSDIISLWGLKTLGCNCVCFEACAWNHSGQSSCVCKFVCMYRALKCAWSGPSYLAYPSEISSAILSRMFQSRVLASCKNLYKSPHATHSITIANGFTQ